MALTVRIYRLVQTIAVFVNVKLWELLLHSFKAYTYSSMLIVDQLLPAKARYLLSRTQLTSSRRADHVSLNAYLHQK